MDYWLIGVGMGAVLMAAVSLWWAINRYHRQQMAERKRTKQRERRAAKKAQSTENNSQPSASVYGVLNGTDKSLHGRGDFNGLPQDEYEASVAYYNRNNNSGRRES